MPPRNYMNPAPQTESAKDAARNFFCDLCQKGYARQPELDSHIASYDHQHRKRLKDLQEASRDPSRTERQRRKEDAEAGLIRMDLGASKITSDSKKGGEKKKAGFKPMTMKRNDESAKEEKAASKPGFKKIGTAPAETEKSKSIFERVTYDIYDPRFPTGCTDACDGT